MKYEKLKMHPKMAKILDDWLYKGYAKISKAGKFSITKKGVKYIVYKR
jgi:predicted transcriptional regulator